MPVLYSSSSLNRQNNLTSKQGRQKYKFIENNFHINQTHWSQKGTLFLSYSLGYPTQSVAQHIIFHWATSQHDASFKENEKIANGSEKTIPHPKKQQIYPIRADGGQSNQTVSICSHLQPVTNHLKQRHTALQVTQIHFIILLRVFYVWDWGNMINETLAEVFGSCAYCTKKYRKNRNLKYQKIYINSDKVHCLFYKDFSWLCLCTELPEHCEKRS